MSVELHIFLQDSRLPSRDAWQQAIAQLSFPAVLESSLDLRKDTGFVPTTYKGQSTGFEFYLESAADILSSYPHISLKAGSCDMCATFRWGGDLTECAAALSAAAALTAIAQGIYYDPEADTIFDANEAVEATRHELGEIDGSIE